MPTIAPPSPATELVARLLSPSNLDARALLDRSQLDSGDLRIAVLALCDEAGKLFGVDPVRMEHVCDSAAVLAERSGDDYLRAMVLMRSGDARRAQGRNAEACAAYDAAAAIFRSLHKPVEAARTRIGWVWATANLGQTETALQGARTARRVFARHGAPFHQAQLSLNVGNIHAEHGHYVEALRQYRSALALFAALGDQGRVYAARCHANCGRALTLLGEHAGATRELQFADALYEQMGEVIGAARVKRSLGEHHMDLGHYTEALRAFNAAESVFRSSGMWSEVVVVGRTIADCYLFLNRAADALAALADVQDDLRRIDSHPDVLGVATRKVAAYLMLGDTTAAVAVTDEVDADSSAGAVQHHAWLAFQRAVAQLREGCTAVALGDALRAEQLARMAGMRRLLSDTLTLQGQARLDLGDVAGAERSARRALRYARALDAAPPLHRTLELLGQVAEVQQRRAAASRYYTAAIEQVEREQRGVIFEFRHSFASARNLSYQRLAALQIQAASPSDALATAERAKSRALSEAISGVIVLRPRGTAMRQLTRRLDSARESYAVACARAAQEEQTGTGRPAAQAERTDQIATLEGEIANLVRRLQLAASADVGDLYGAGRAVAMSSPPAGTTLVEFFASGEDLLRFRVDQTGVSGTVLPGAIPEVKRLLDIFFLNLEAVARDPERGRGALTDHGRKVLRRLYQRLLGDVDLGSCRSLVIVPHGLLHYLPFHALHDGERFLVERAAISYAPSAALYAICRSRSRRRRTGNALVLAHAAVGRLPFTRIEADAVATELGTTAYGDENANRALLASEGQRADLIHIAAHGQFRPDAPLFSRIEFADGPLTTADVFDLKLRARLVVLSACETARAVVGGGDELVGMSRAWLYAGAAGLVVSQWRVEDAATADLMRTFYQRLERRDGPAAALREAQIKFIREPPENGLSHPFYWAGFQYIGADHDEGGSARSQGSRKRIRTC